MSLMAYDGESMEERTVIVRGLSETTAVKAIIDEMETLDCSPIVWGYCDGKTAMWFIFNMAQEALIVFEKLNRKVVDGAMLSTQVRQLEADNRLIYDEDGLLSKRICVEQEREYTVLLRGVTVQTRLVELLAWVLETQFIPMRVGFAKGGLNAFSDHKTKEEAQLVARLLSKKPLKGRSIEASAPS